MEPQEGLRRLEELREAQGIEKRMECLEMVYEDELLTKEGKRDILGIVGNEKLGEKRGD